MTQAKRLVREIRSDRAGRFEVRVRVGIYLLYGDPVQVGHGAPTLPLGPVRVRVSRSRVTDTYLVYDSGAT
jgi:hypothetical protein